MTPYRLQITVSGLQIIEVVFKFVVVAVVVVGGLAVTTMSNPNPSCIELELGSGFDNSYLEISFGQKCYSDRFFWTKLFFSVRNYFAQIFFWGPNSFWTKCIENILLQKMSF